VRVLLLADCCVAFNEVDLISVDYSSVLASNSKVVGDQHDWPFERGCHPGLPWAAEHGPLIIIVTPTLSPSRVILVLVLSMVVVSSSWFHLDANDQSNFVSILCIYLYIYPLTKKHAIMIN